MTEVMYACASM